MNMEQKDIKLLLYECLQKKDPQERNAFLDSACGDDLALRQRIDQLLQAYDRAGDFLEIPLFPGQPDSNDCIDEGPGSIIGHYKLLEKIGEGGMAIVYMAEQEEPLKRRVALKIIKLGMDTKQVIARFEAERQALAIMDHPNIARVIDAGATQTGRPYFVMELVKGTTITAYCDSNNLNTIERLGLFTQVCSAVQHAHQKGIIHRDIKPTNVLVTLRDGKPVPKVIDFGIAKATSQKLTEKTLFTRYAQMVGTPAYMSPEQAEYSELDIDTRTDIYSLGVLLYELLTGVTPFEAEKLLHAGYAEIQRIIREEEPVKPSTKLSTLGETLTDVAEHRKASPEVLRRLVSGDLDWIVMKTLEKDRARRYTTVSELAQDIERHLKNEPVLAAAPSTLYRMRKFVRRHHNSVAAVLLIVVSLLLGFAGTMIGFLEANSQRRLASTQRQVAEENLELVLQVLDDTLLQRQPESELGLRRIFGKLAELSARWPNLSDYRKDLVGCYVELGYSLKVGQIEQVDESYHKVLGIIDNLRTDAESVPQYLEPLALIHRDLCLLMKTSTHAEKAEYHLEQAVALFERLVADFPTAHSYHANLAECLSLLDGAADNPRKREWNEKAFEHTVRAVRLYPDPSVYRELLVRQSRRLQSKSYYERAITLLEDKLANVPSCTRELSILLSNLSDLQRSLGDTEGSQSAKRRATTYWQQSIAPFWKSFPSFGDAMNLSTPLNSVSDDSLPGISSDGLSLYFVSNRTGGSGGHDLWMATRLSEGESWSEPTNLGPTVNSPSLELWPKITPDGLSLYFYSTRRGGYGSGDIWMTKRSSISEAWEKPVNLGPIINSVADDGAACVSADDMELYFASNRSGSYDLYVSRRVNKDSLWDPPISLGSAVNSAFSESGPYISLDGLLLFFHSNRPGGFGSFDLYLARRAKTGAEWSDVINLGPQVNTVYPDVGANISADGRTLYFSGYPPESDRPGGLGGIDLWQVSILK